MASQKVIEKAIEEVHRLIEAYSDGGEEWVVYDGVGAWEVLFGYSHDAGLLRQLDDLFSCQYEEVYQGFLARWREAYPEPVRKFSRMEVGVFEPVNSHNHDDRCLCPGCSGFCQDDYEFFSGTGQYAPGNSLGRPSEE